MENHGGTSRIPATRLCTIAATNYLPRVRVLAESVLAHGPHRSEPDAPGHRLAVFLVDDPEGTTPTDHEDFDVLPLSALPLDPRWFGCMTLYYDVMELATAVKPWVLDGLSRAEPTPAVVAYLDPDTELFAPLDDVWQLAADHDAAVLTPHALEPFPRDTLRMDEDALLASGVFNLGFIALPASPEGQRLLDWWQERLRFDAIVDQPHMRFTDQRWMDLVPTLFRHVVLRDPGVNVAYWNLHERPLTDGPTGLNAGEAPLRLFHYSGFAPERPHLLSTHQGLRPRVLRSASPQLGMLLDRYASALAAQMPTSPTTYRWAELPNGLVLTPWLRRRIRTELMAVDLGHPTLHTRPPGPGEPDWVPRLMDWLAAPVHPRMLPRWVDALLANRIDVAVALADLDPGTFAEKLGDWLCTSGVAEEGLTATFALRLATLVTDWGARMATSDVGSAPRRHPDDAPLPHVVAVIGFGASVSGLATGAQQLADAIATTGADHRTLTIAHPNPRTHLRTADLGLFDLGPPLPPADITVACLNAETLDYLGPLVRQRLFGAGYRVGYWWWEVDLYPAESLDALELVDEIWVGSTFVADVLRPFTSRPVHRVPLPPRTPTPGPVDRRGLGIPEGTSLYTFAFDYSSVLARKNPLGLIEAWRQAFTPSDGCTLVLKSINAEDHPVAAEAVRLAAAGRTDIVLIDGFLSDGVLDGLVAQSAAYVSLHRAEGLGLGLLDACLLDTPVIATAAGGCLDFLAPDSSFLVPASHVAVGPGSEPYPAEATWAEPDLDVAVAHLRAVAADPDRAARMAAVARIRALDTYDAGLCRDVVVQRLAAIRGEAVSPDHLPPLGSTGRTDADPHRTDQDSDQDNERAAL